MPVLSTLLLMTSPEELWEVDDFPSLQMGEHRENLVLGHVVLSICDSGKPVHSKLVQPNVPNSNSLAI